MRRMSVACWGTIVLLVIPVAAYAAGHPNDDDVPGQALDRSLMTTHGAPLPDVPVGALQQRRSTAFSPRSQPRVAVAATSVGQQYSDTCDDTDGQGGDIAKLFNTDDGARVSWAWTTCVDAQFRGTEDEAVIFHVDSDETGAFRADHVVIQYMDGYYEVYATGESPEPAQWQLVDSGTGDVGPSSDGRRTIGSFTIDAVAADFPEFHFFVFESVAGDVTLDTIPNADQPYYPTFPTACSIEVFHRAHVRTDPGELPAVVGRLRALGLPTGDLAPHLGAVAVQRVDERSMEALRGLPGVVQVERPSPRSVFAADPHPTAWAVEQLGLDVAWVRQPDHAVHVAVLDSGVDATRPDLGGRVASGFDAIAGRTIPAGTNSAFAAHGTAVAGVMAATRDNAREVTGVNRAITVRPVRTSSHDGCIDTASVVAGLDWATSQPAVRIINMSYGGPDHSSIEADAIRAAADAGKILIAATGNDGSTAPGRASYPAAFATVIGVGASTASGDVAAYSQRAATDLVAPGGDGSGSPARDVAVLHEHDTVTFGAGTSYAAPYVAGAVSLWLSRVPGATTTQARAALQAAARDIAGTTADGAGILDVDALLAAAPVATARSIAAACPEGSVPSARFPDVGGTHAGAIDCVAWWDVADGYPDGTYRPVGAVTRDQMATFIARLVDAADGRQLPSDAPDAFDDDDGLHEPSIDRLAAVGIVGGYPDGSYRPRQAVSRGQMAAFLIRAYEYVTASEVTADGSYFHDDDATSQEPVIDAAATLGLTGGSGDDPRRYRPTADVTRGQMGTFLARLGAALVEAGVASPPS